MRQNTDKLKKKTNNASFNSELPMKDKDKRWKTIIKEKRTELRGSMMKWLRSSNQSTDNKFKLLNRNLKE